jgi:hypothetical protein
MCVTTNELVNSDILKVTSVVTNLLGEDAIASEKTEFNRIQDWIGWCINLDLKTISIARKNLLKTLYIFIQIDTDQKVKFKTLQTAASLASRYSMVCRQMKPYTLALYTDISLFEKNNYNNYQLSEHSCVDIIMWRAFLCLLKFDENMYARKLNSFRERKPAVLFEYDSSLSSFAVGVSVWNANNNLYELKAYTAVDSPFELTCDSSKQNTYEYLAIMLGLLLAKYLNIEKGFSFDLIGDSMSSLSWCAHDRVNSLLARRAGIGFTLLSVHMDATVCEIRHLAGKLNIVYDGLSRGLRGIDVGLRPDLFVAAATNSNTMQYLTLCDPDVPLVSVDEHITLSQQFISFLHSEYNIF